MTHRQLVMLGMAVVFCNVWALLASIFVGSYGLIPANLFGIGLGVWLTARLIRATDR